MSLLKSLIVAAVSVPFLIAGASAAPEQAAEDAPAAAESGAPKADDEPGTSTENGSEAKGEEKTAQNDEDKVVCKYIARTGTRFGEKVCATRKQWEQARKDSQESVKDSQRRATEYRTPN